MARSPDISFTVHDYKYASPGVRNLTWIDYDKDRELARFLTDGKTITTLENPLLRMPFTKNSTREEVTLLNGTICHACTLSGLCKPPVVSTEAITSSTILIASTSST